MWNLLDLDYEGQSPVINQQDEQKNEQPFQQTQKQNQQIHQLQTLEINKRGSDKLDLINMGKPLAISPTAQKLQEIQQSMPIKPAPEIYSFSQCSKLQCKKLGFNIFAQGVPPIKIAGYVNIILCSFEKKAGGLFKKDYVVYNVKTGEEYTVQRRYKDFQWLQQTLLKLFPGVGIPSFSEKKAKKTAKNKAQKRAILLEFFLNELAKSELFRNSKYFVDFLRLTDPAQFKQLKKFGEKLSKPNKFESLLNMTGTVIFVPDIKLNNFETFIQQEEPVYEKIKDLFKAITQHLSDVSKLIKDIEDSLQTLTNLCQKYEINQDYDPLQEMAKKLDEQITKCSSNQYNRMYNMFRYQTQNFSQIKSILKQRNDLQAEFSNRKDFKVEQINELYSSRENAKQIDELEFPAKNSKLLAYQLGYMNWRTIEEIKTFLQHRQIGLQAFSQEVLN
ncbi:unnamed protein product (macronuclear) [Paramecium tetraurelia]|uniref:PX domain-containing protein n=1 Tax=Paramecium tetraurelia TaxID=5888 RepID=A0D6H7_PARTE|nr:uncharacterized protein GSPATT00001685001 [Paramecium tetraurelia]CAK78644.1 unnamed protein product [Paramecium tetraurelia]|eukprot:XP_001446041.1 hypothetical protein (macronuclear) [Paramecium tetraurelia strain d4-2]